GYGPGVTALGGFLGGLLSLIYFFIKALSLFFLMVLIRATVPRLRVDQLMGFAWKFLLPLVLVNIMSASLWVALTRWDQQAQVFTELMGPPASDNYLRYGVAVGVTLLLNIGALLAVMGINNRRAKEHMHITDEELALGLTS
ncbi:MAG TPA: NADH-quinone oxidoreductase subunit H, partial [Herpetosiphonaceae bacterium]